MRSTPRHPANVCRFGAARASNYASAILSTRALARRTSLTPLPKTRP